MAVMRGVTTEDVAAAAETVRDGGTVIYPTETCYGLGCDATDMDAVEKIYDIKERPQGKGLTVIVADLAMAEEYCTLTDAERRVVEAFMPGPLTLVAEKREGFPDATNTDFVFRIPGSDVARDLVRAAGVPVVATSANRSGEGPHYRVDGIAREVVDAVDVVLDAGVLDRAAPSTIVRLDDGAVAVLREGPVAAGDIAEVVDRWR